MDRIIRKTMGSYKVDMEPIEQRDSDLPIAERKGFTVLVVAENDEAARQVAEKSNGSGYSAITARHVRNIPFYREHLLPEEIFEIARAYHRVKELEADLNRSVYEGPNAISTQDRARGKLVDAWLVYKLRTPPEVRSLFEDIRELEKRLGFNSG